MVLYISTKGLANKNMHSQGLCETAPLDFTCTLGIIIDKDNNVNIIDFDYCKREVRAYDISNFMTKVLKRREWDINCANLIIDAYNEVSPLSKDEYRVLFAFLLFPQRFWRLGNRYYYNEVNWATNTFNKKIEALISEQEQYMKFIDEFKKVYNQKEDL